MSLLLVLICLGIFYKIYSTTGETRYNWFVGGLLFIYSSFIVISKPQIPAHRFFVIAFLLSLIKNSEITWHNIKQHPLFVPLLVYAVGLTLITFMSPYLSSFYKLYKPLMRFLDTYMIIMIGYYGTNNVKLANSKVSMFVIIVALYGLFSYFFSVDPYRMIFADFKDYYDDYFFGDRRRVAATWAYPISYGFICSILFYVFFLFSEHKNKIWVLLLLAVSVFICGSRTALLTWLFIGVVFMFSILPKRDFVIFLLVFVSISTILPPVQKKMHELTSSIAGSDDTAGSSMEMRNAQLIASLGVAAQFPITGGGLDYIQEQMGFGTDEWVDDGDYYGFESYFYSLIIERGILGVLLELALVIYLIVVFWRRRIFNNVCAYLGLGFFIGFVIFALVTGPLDAWTIAMFYLGAMLKQTDRRLENQNFNFSFFNE